MGGLEHASEDGDGPLKATITPVEGSGAQQVVIPNGSAPRRTSLSHETSEMESRWEEMSKERQSLRAEVKSLREALEDIQEKHEKDLSALRAQLDEARGGKEHAEQQYRNLLGKLNTIKSQLGERLKADAVRVTFHPEKRLISSHMHFDLAGGPLPSPSPDRPARGDEPDPRG